MGDLGNIEAGDDGKVALAITDKAIQISGPNSIIGRAVVVSNSIPKRKPTLGIVNYSLLLHNWHMPQNTTGDVVKGYTSLEGMVLCASLPVHALSF